MITGDRGGPGALWPYMLPHDQQGRTALCAESAAGVRVRFADGSVRLDGSSGLWNANLGYGNPVIADAVAGAMRDASYLSSWSYENTRARAAADALIDLAGSGLYARVLFSTSGGAANEVAMKLARHYHALRGEPERKVVLGLQDGYHGLTYGAFALTDASLGQRMYGVDRRFVGHVPANDPVRLSAVLRALAGRVAAVVVEPVLGTGAVPLTAEYVAALLAARSEHGFLLVADEVSTGYGRIGNAVFETTGWPEPPDVLVTAKAMTNGTLAAAALVVGEPVVAEFVEQGAVLGHAETQAGTAVAGAAVVATAAELHRLEAVANSHRLSGHLDLALGRLAEEHRLVAASTGAGCLRAVHLAQDAGVPLPPAEVSAVVAAIRNAGALVHPGPGCVQLVPALIYTEDELNELMSLVSAGITAYERAR
ncbi:daptide-type RiPP biosynthesis aminotransferase [Streptomyces sp. NPDC091027]|uniref:daptide-type RiPP biosynthesis aminotransferase n=1 Tax=Streptomyces sp. NPDC091027 TaxID=3365971 RepID=UPI003821745D